MSRYAGLWIPVGCALMVAGALLLIVWDAAKRHEQVEHCEQRIGGVAVQRSPGGGVVCMRSDAVLKAYS